MNNILSRFLTMLLSIIFMVLTGIIVFKTTSITLGVIFYTLGLINAFVAGIIAVTFLADAIVANNKNGEKK